MIDKGFPNLLWFIGVVEDNNDPQKLGRVRTRIFGVHSQKQDDLDTQNLPWANIVNGTYNAAYKPPEIGSWVLGFFIDGNNCQQPVLMGTFLGMPTTTPSTYGDGNSGFKPYGDGSGVSKLYQPDMPRLARAEELHNTPVLLQNVDGDETVKTADGKEWKTPTSSYGTSYPNNLVYESKAGHVVEIDDTPGAERLNIFHKDGSYIEMAQGGRTVIKSTGQGYIIIGQDGYVYIKGDMNVNVDGNANISVKNDVNLSVAGSLNTDVRGDFVVSASGRIDLNAGETIRSRAAGVMVEAATDNVDIVAKNNLNIKSNNSVNMKSAANTNIQSQADMNLKSGSGMFTESTGEFNIKSGGNVAQSGSKIYLNSDDSAAKGAAEAAEASVTDMKAPEHRSQPVRMQQTTLMSYSGYGGSDVGFSEPKDNGGGEGGCSQEQPLNPAQQVPDTTSEVFSNKTNNPEIERYRTWLNYIAKCEGTDRGNGYNNTLGYGKFCGGEKNLVSMNLAQIKALQGEILHHPKNNLNSTACGRYQIIRDTLKGLQKNYNIPDSTIFTPDLQDQMAVWITKNTKGTYEALRGQWDSFKKQDPNVVLAHYRTTLV